MLKKSISRLNPTQPMLDSTRAVGGSVVHQALRIKRLIVDVLKAIAKCWSFFKDIHFSFYTIIPIISSFTSLGKTESLALWGLFFLPILVVITFRTLDSMFDLRPPESWPSALQPNSARREEPPSIIASPAGATKYRARAHGFAPLQSRMNLTPQRRHRALRPLRSRRPGSFW
jgi:hypothetical protein